MPNLQCIANVSGLRTVYVSSRREMAAGSVSPETDFSWLGEVFFEENVSNLLSVGWQVMESVDKSVENFDLADIPKELYLFDDGGMAEWIGDEVPAVKKRKAKDTVAWKL